MLQLRATFGDGLLQSHRVFLENLQALRSVRSAPGAPPAELVRCLDVTRAQLAEHFRFEEENGYLASVVEVHPHLGRAVERLAQDHRELLRRLDELRAEAQGVRAVDDGLREKIRKWAQKV